ncbi:AmmeMemoRadiSam system protein A [Parasutterella muris]|uniref:AmmeMemoRadiSam system protein A n=1 Tax=Parasutterella muris TaxID=2565572 RepID=UPI00203E3438|nr:AmmeMemoRadiSam system protein A [Parasutterella muris]
MMEIKPEVCESAGECGHRSFVIMAGAFDKRKVDAHVLSYEGPFGVGYGVATFEGGEADPNRNYLDQYIAFENKAREERMKHEDAYVKLARLSAETFVRTHQFAGLPKDLPSELLNQRAGAFVSIHEYGKLRGCIGTTEPTQQNLALEIIANAVSTATRDPRFPPVRPEELSSLVYKVDVLSPAEKIDSESERNTKKYGVIVENGDQRGLLLPDLEGVDTVAQQIAIAKQKANIAPHEAVQLYRFTMTRHQ